MMPLAGHWAPQDIVGQVSHEILFNEFLKELSGYADFEDFRILILKNLLSHRNIFEILGSNMLNFEDLDTQMRFESKTITKL